MVFGSGTPIESCEPEREDKNTKSLELAWRGLQQCFVDKDRYADSYELRVRRTGARGRALGGNLLRAFAFYEPASTKLIATDNQRSTETNHRLK